MTSGREEPYVPRSISCFNQRVYDEAQGIITWDDNHYDQDYEVSQLLHLIIKSILFIYCL